MKKRLLITGGSGFLGQLLMPILSNEYEVYITGLLSESDIPRYYQLEISNKIEVERVMSEIRPHIIIHAAAIKSIVEAENDPIKCFEVNIQGSNNIAQSAIRNNVEFVLGISSNKACLGGKNLYSMSKMAMERLFVSINASTVFSCLRFGNILWAPDSFLWDWKEMWDNEKKIESTGFEMSRFICSKAQVIEDVLIVLNNQSILSNKIITRNLESAKIGDMLNIWVEELGGEYEKTTSRLGDLTEDLLVSDNEKENTELIKFKDQEYFLFSPGVRILNSIKEKISTQNQLSMPKSKLKHIILEPFK